MSRASQEIRPSQQLPSVGRALLAFTAALMLGALGAFQAVTLVASELGTVAALPLGLLTFIVVSAVALVGAARLDAGR